MNESTPRHRAPLIPSISTLNQPEPAASVEHAPKEAKTICVVVVTVIEVETPEKA